MDAVKQPCNKYVHAANTCTEQLHVALHYIIGWAFAGALGTVLSIFNAHIYTSGSRKQNAKLEVQLPTQLRCV